MYLYFFHADLYSMQKVGRFSGTMLISVTTTLRLLNFQ